MRPCLNKFFKEKNKQDDDYVNGGTQHPLMVTTEPVRDDDLLRASQNILLNKTLVMHASIVKPQPPHTPHYIASTTKNVK